MNSSAFFILVLYCKLGLGLWNSPASTVLFNTVTLNLGFNLRPMVPVCAVADSTTATLCTPSAELVTTCPGL